MPDTLQNLAARLDQFARERDWGRHHSPKNLASALIVESAELLEHFQWLTEAQSHALPAAKQQAVADEVADVLLYLVQLCNVLGIDPVRAAEAKLAVNARRFPPGAAGTDLAMKSGMPREPREADAAGAPPAAD